MQKKIICPNRKRKIPQRFSWIDHRLVKHEHFKNTSSGAMKLYLFLTTVGDAEGLSFYGASSLSSSLNQTESEICKFRKELISSDLIAYEKPFYQVLDLSPPTKEEEANIREVFAKIASSVHETPKSIWREGNIEKKEAKTIAEIIQTFSN